MPMTFHSRENPTEEVVNKPGGRNDHPTENEKENAENKQRLEKTL